MNNKRIKEYKNKPAIAVRSIAGEKGIEILEIQHGVDDHVIIRGYTDDLHRYKLHTNSKGTWFRYQNGCRYYLEEFMKA